MFRKIITGLVATGIVAGTMFAATSADAKPYWWKNHPHYYGYNHGYYGGYDNGGGLIAAGILGFIGGTVLSDLSHRNYYPGYCETHFKTYSSTTHSYMGYDGQSHPCFD